MLYIKFNFYREINKESNIESLMILSVFGLRNEVIYLLLTSHFFIWFVE
jgi:hypothetical protein